MRNRAVVLVALLSVAVGLPAVAGAASGRAPRARDAIRTVRVVREPLLTPSAEPVSVAPAPVVAQAPPVASHAVASPPSVAIPRRTARPVIAAAVPPSEAPPATQAPATAPPPAATPQGLGGDFEGFAAGESWPDGSTHGGWRTQFTGFGHVGVVQDGSHALSLSPKTSTDAGETHASLVVSTASFGDLDLSARARTVRQLRTGSAPNTWETAWVLWRYTDNTHFYYVVLKTNGWEIGKEDPAYPGAQRFLATGTDRAFPAGGWHDVRVQMTGNTVTVSVDGSALATITDAERPYASGAIGLYTEDAEAHFDDVKI